MTSEVVENTSESSFGEAQAIGLAFWLFLLELVGGVAPIAGENYFGFREFNLLFWASGDGLFISAVQRPVSSRTPRQSQLHALVVLCYSPSPSTS
jgi:hypothetical protein